MTWFDPYEDLFFGWEALCSYLYNFTLSGCDYVPLAATTGYPTYRPTYLQEELFQYHWSFILLGIALLSCSGCTLLKCICCQDDFEECCDCECYDEEDESSIEVDMAQDERNAQQHGGEPDVIAQADGSSSLSLSIKGGPAGRASSPSLSIKDSEGEPPRGEHEVSLEFSPEGRELAPGEEEPGVRPVYVDMEQSVSTSHRILALAEITSQSATLDYSEGD